MIRAIVYLLISVFVVTFLRLVIGMIMKGMRDMMAPAGPSPAPGPAPHRTPTTPVSSELKRDPVCGTFVPASTSFQKNVRGQAVYFCSAECRDKHAV